MKKFSLLLFLPLWAATYYEYDDDIHVLEIDPREEMIVPMSALDESYGKETVSHLATRYGAEAAINGGFYVWDSGAPAGPLRVDGEWYGFSQKDRGALLWNDGDLKVERLAQKPYLVINGQRIEFSDDLLLFLPNYHRTTLTDQDRLETIVVDGRVSEVRQGGSSAIPPNGFVLSSPLRFWPVGTVIELHMPPASARNIVGGVPILIKNGEILDPHLEPARDSFFEPHRRTAVGIRRDGIWLFVVADKPLTLEETADVMADLGAVDAINLDGGGSSTMFYKGESKTVERPVGDAILVKKRAMK